jgi:hypothetical protein
MTKKKQVKKPEEPEFDYAEFSIKFTKLCMNLSIKFTKLCMNLSIKFIKLVYTLSKYTYKRIQVYLAWRALKKDVKECAACRDYFQDQIDSFNRREVK